MPLQPGFFEAFYESPLQHPIFLWIAALLALGVVLTRDGLAPSMRRFCIGLVVLSCLDAWLTTREIFGLGELEGAWKTLVPLFFVLAGDLRYWLVVMLADEHGAIEADRGGIARALGLTIIVPISSQVVMALLPDDLATSRVLFLVYEVMFASLTLAMMRLHPRLVSSAWLRRVSVFVVLYYALWAVSDLVILTTGSDLGFALRVVPNGLYYGGLIAVIAVCAPRSKHRE